MSARAAPTWWIRAAGRAYGPFASERLPGFVREGRLTPETSMARDEAGPWLPAGRDPALGELFVARPAPARPMASPTAAPEPGPGPTQVAPEPSKSVPSPPGAHAFLVFAELLAGREEAFARRLSAIGQTVRARPGLWLMCADGDAAPLRNALSQSLGEGESLMVVQTHADEAAWFNLGGESDRALRALWSAGSGAQTIGRNSRA